MQNHIAAQPRFPMSSDTFTYRAGAASVCITPDEPLWLAGYAVRTAPARGKGTELFASAWAFEDEAGQGFVIASLENLSITPAITEPVAALLQARNRLSRHEIL